MRGLPVGLLFSLPIILLLYTGRFWFKRADMVANSQLNVGVLIVAIILIAVFVSVVYKRHQWEMKEQQYQELKAREAAKS
jgi:membrane protein DedA with SNARE-associated domain